MNFSTIIAGDVLDMEFSLSMDTMRITQNKSKQEIDCVSLSANSFSLILNGRTYHLTITTQLDGYEVTVDHHPHFVKVKDRLEFLLEKFGMQGETICPAGEIHAQIPGLVSCIFVKEGDRVKTGAKLCILEAMKMENEITSPKNGTVTHIHIDSGDNVEKGNLLMEISD
jgi:acetyl/propionyl-CoA carboxylase alpha subunit